MSTVDVLAVMGESFSGGSPSVGARVEAIAAVRELVDCVGDAQSLLSEIDASVRAEHAKNGAPKSESVAGIISARLTAALARVGGANP